MGLVSLIQYEGDNSTIIWKHPEVDFNTGTQLIVHESQEAIFFLNGEALDTFSAGRHTLDTQNIPLLTKKLFSKVTGDQTPFHAEVYFVNMVEQMGIKWGTDNRVYFVDPCNNDYSFPVGARGELSLKVNNSRKLLLKLVGTEEGLNINKLYDYFRAPIMMHIKSFLPKVLREGRVSIFDLDQHLAEYSKQLQQLLISEMDDYGITLEKFWITDILKPEDDPTYIELRKLRGRQSIITPESALRRQQALYDQEIELTRQRTEVEKERMRAMMQVENERYRQQQLGYSYVDSRKYDVMEKLAENEGTGSDLRNAAMGLGMGFGMGGPIGSAFGDLASSTLNTQQNPYAMNLDNVISQNDVSGNTGYGVPKMGVNGNIPNMLHLQENVDVRDQSDMMQEQNVLLSDGSQDVNTNTDDISGSEYVYCENCGNKMRRTAKFCSECGTKREV